MKMKKALENQGLFLAEKERFEAASRPPPSHSRRASLGDSLPSAPCFGRFRCEKTILNRFFLLPLPENRHGRVQISTFQRKNEAVQRTTSFFGGEGALPFMDTTLFTFIFVFGSIKLLKAFILSSPFPYVSI